MFDNIPIYGSKPYGKCIFIACDYDYYCNFFQKLYQSIRLNFTNFDTLHCHIIGVREEWDRVIKDNLIEFCSFSFEDIDDVKLNLEQMIYDKKQWDNIISLDVKEMLLRESSRNSFIRRFLFRCIKVNDSFYDYFINTFPPLTYLNDSKIKTYYSIRRFVMPSDFFMNTSCLLVIDVDSVFTSSINFNDLINHGTRAFTRENMWSKYLAGFVLFSFESKGNSLSLYTLKSLLVDILYRQGFHWGLDQVALDELSHQNLIVPLTDFPYSFKDDQSSDVIFVSYKGASKWRSNSL